MTLQMTTSLITLTTDFGEDSPYVAAIKGVILSVNPDARIVDLSHQIPPQDVRHAAYFLAHSVPYFPSGALHVVVVDPEVGTDRALLYVECAGQGLLVPDNGCWTLLPPPSMVRRVEESRYWRPTVSSTFHGRDILAPVAGWLSRGLDPANLGEKTLQWVRLEIAAAMRDGDTLRGEVVFVDHFGNLITNIPGEWLPTPNDRPIRIHVGKEILATHVRSYANTTPGTPIVLTSSSGTLEVAVAQGNAAAEFRVRPGTPVAIMLH